MGISDKPKILNRFLFFESKIEREDSLQICQRLIAKMDKQIVMAIKVICK